MVGPLGGAIISLPAFVHHEWLSMPVAASAGLIGGLVRQVMPNTEDIWKFRAVHVFEHSAIAGAAARQRRVPWEMVPMACAHAGGGAPLSLGHATKLQWLFYIDAGKGCGNTLLLLLGTMMAVAVP